MAGDITLSRDVLGFSLLRVLHLPSPRWVFCALFLNDVFRGFYLAEEPIDEAFLKSRFPPGNGGHLLYRVFGGMRHLGHNPSVYQSAKSRNIPDFQPLTPQVPIPSLSFDLSLLHPSPKGGGGLHASDEICGLFEYPK